MHTRPGRPTDGNLFSSVRIRISLSVCLPSFQGPHFDICLCLVRLRLDRTSRATSSQKSFSGARGVVHPRSMAHPLLPPLLMTSRTSPSSSSISNRDSFCGAALINLPLSRRGLSSSSLSLEDAEIRDARFAPLTHIENGICDQTNIMCKVKAKMGWTLP